MAATVAPIPSTLGPPEGHSRRGGLFRQPPRLLFHGILAIAAAVQLWAFSYPGVHFLGMTVAFLVLSIALGVWLLRLVTYGVARRKRRQPGRARWFLVAPLGAFIVLGLLMANIPLKARWQLGKNSFEHALNGVERRPDRWAGSIDRRIGTYRITHVAVVEQGVVFRERTGAFTDDAGFAYLPDGPSPEMANGNFENPQWVALGDHWYSWVASW